MIESNVEQFTVYKKQALNAAKQLNYKEDVIKKIKNAATEYEICRILTTARHNS